MILFIADLKLIFLIAAELWRNFNIMLYGMCLMLQVIRNLLKIASLKVYFCNWHGFYFCLRFKFIKILFKIIKVIIYQTNLNFYLMDNNSSLKILHKVKNL